MADAKPPATLRPEPLSQSKYAPRSSGNSSASASASASSSPVFNTMSPPPSPGMARFFDVPWLKMPGKHAEVDRDLKLAATGLFNATTVAAAIQHGCSVAAIRDYLDHFPPQAKMGLVWVKVSAVWNVLFFAIERNCAECVRLLLECGVDPGVASPAPFRIPAHVFAIILANFTAVNSTDVVKTLLEFGADTKAIPPCLWQDYIKDPKPDMDKDTFDDKAVGFQWYSNYKDSPMLPDLYAVLAQTFHLSHRYSFFRAHLIDNTKPRAKQMSEAFNIQGILRMPYHLIGQGPAATLVSNQVFADYSFNMHTPLVMAFAGPSGHGKTELAKQMGDLLDIPSKVIDCAQVRVEWQLFGAAQGYHGAKQGSPLNNFIAENDGRRAVVFLDEFDKTVQPVREALLTICESGRYTDRRSNKDVDARSIIWILATNLGDTEIMDHHSAELEGKSELQRYGAPVERLQRELRKRCKEEWKAPFTGRIRLIVPFFPFSADEQAVIAHKFLLELRDALRKPLDLSPAANRLVGHVDLHMPDATRVARLMAREHYDVDLGARSYFGAVDAVKSKFCVAYKDVPEAIVEATNAGPLQRYTLRVKSAGGRGKGEDQAEQEVMVYADGFTEFRSAAKQVDCGISEMDTAMSDLCVS